MNKSGSIENPEEGVMYFATLEFYGLANLVYSGLFCALPEAFRTSKDKFWVVECLAGITTKQETFHSGISGDFVFVCKNKNQVRSLKLILETHKEEIFSSAMKCVGIVEIAHALLNGYEIYIQIEEGMILPVADAPIVGIGFLV